MHLVLSGDLGESFLFLEQLDNNLCLEGGCVMSFHTSSLHDPCAVHCLNSLGHYRALIFLAKLPASQQSILSVFFILRIVSACTWHRTLHDEDPAKRAAACGGHRWY